MLDGPKLAIYIGAFLLLSALAYKAVDAIGDNREAKITKQWQAKYDALAAESRAKEETQRIALNTASAHHEEVKDAIRNDATPIPIISVPKCPRRPGVPSAAAVAGESRETATDGLDRENGQARAAVQFSNGLREYAKDAKIYSAQLTDVIQSWPK